MNLGTLPKPKNSPFSIKYFPWGAIKVYDVNQNKFGFSFQKNMPLKVFKYLSMLPINMYICNYKNIKLDFFWLTLYIFITPPGKITFKKTIFFVLGLYLISLLLLAIFNCDLKSKSTHY